LLAVVAQEDGLFMTDWRSNRRIRTSGAWLERSNTGAFSPDGSVYVGALVPDTGKQRICEWDTQTWCTLGEFSIPGEYLYQMKISANDATVVATGCRGAYIWRLGERRLRQSILLTEAPKIALSPDGLFLALADRRGITIWQR